MGGKILVFQVDIKDEHLKEGSEKYPKYSNKIKI
jgi:hypothetical protein